MKNAIYIILTLIGAGVAAWQMVNYINSVNTREFGSSGNMTALIIAVIGIIVAIACGGLFLASRVNKEEELHITK